MCIYIYTHLKFPIEISKIIRNIESILYMI